MKLFRAFEQPALSVCLFFRGRGLVGEAVQLLAGRFMRTAALSCAGCFGRALTVRPSPNQSANGLGTCQVRLMI
jgi:hypothetical protein